MPGPPPTGSPFSQTPLGPGTRCHSTLLPVNLLKPSRDHCSQPHSTKGLPRFYLHLYISSHFLTAREGSANTLQQYENTPEAVICTWHRRRKKKKKSTDIPDWQQSAFIFIPPATKLGGIYWNHHVRPSFRCPSVRPSVCPAAFGFPAHNCFPFTPIIMKLHMQTPHEARMCPIDFEVKRTKVKVTMHKLLKMVSGA